MFDIYRNWSDGQLHGKRSCSPLFLCPRNVHSGFQLHPRAACSSLTRQDSSPSSSTDNTWLTAAVCVILNPQLSLGYILPLKCICALKSSSVHAAGQDWISIGCVLFTNKNPTPTPFPLLEIPDTWCTSSFYSFSSSFSSNNDPEFQTMPTSHSCILHLST